MRSLRQTVQYGLCALGALVAGATGCVVTTPTKSIEVIATETSTPQVVLVEPTASATLEEIVQPTATVRVLPTKTPTVTVVPTATYTPLPTPTPKPIELDASAAAPSYEASDNCVGAGGAYGMIPQYRMGEPGSACAIETSLSFSPDYLTNIGLNPASLTVGVYGDDGQLLGETVALETTFVVNDLISEEVRDNSKIIIELLDGETKVAELPMRVEYIKEIEYREITGGLFFDINGSGLPDSASFPFDPDRLEYALQPYLLASIYAYLAEHPNTGNGALVTLSEPGLSGYTVCIADTCDVTDGDGNFSVVVESNGGDKILRVVDPYANDPALAMRYFNVWKAPAVIAAHDVNGVHIPLQNLNDTQIVPLANGIAVDTSGKEPLEVMVMQGFVTLPFLKEQVPTPYIFNYFDIIGNRFFDEAGRNNYFSSQDGIMLNYNGKYRKPFLPAVFDGRRPQPGVGDSHTGEDFFVEIGNFGVSGVPNSRVWYLANQDGELRVDSMFPNPIALIPLTMDI
jgi:hypothetical protein